tara:strand:+ start:6227 stop:7366 length:1140 start_codon:yes stop_codon:yes gene_type:complete
MSAPPKATLPTIQHTRVVASDDKLADAVVEQRAKQAVEDDHFQTIQCLLISKRLFETSKHKLVVEVEGAKGNSFFPLNFPDIIAMYSEARNQETGDVTDARWYVENQKYVMTSTKHLPSFVDIKKAAAEFETTHAHRFVHDGPNKIDKTYARPHLQGVPEEAGVCNLIVEAELQMPVVVSKETRLRFVVQGFEGTDGSSKTTDWVTGSELVQQANSIFDMRKQFISAMNMELEKVGPMGACHVHPHPLLYGGLVFSHRPDGVDSCKEFFENTPIPFRDDSHALLTQFSMFWRRHDAAPNKRALAIGSASVAFKFTRPRPSDDTQLMECAACLDYIDRFEWQCSGCGKHMHRECISLWLGTCQASGRPLSCPLCRAAVEA